MNLRAPVRILLLAAAACSAALATGGGKECIASGAITSKLFCYYSDARRVDVCRCSHVVLPADTPHDQLRGLIEDKGAKVLLTVHEFNQNLLKTLNATKVFGLEVQLTKLSSKQDISDFISTVRTKLGSDLFIALSVPAKPETLAKYYDFKTLSKHADVFTLQTHFLGANRNVTFHPSRLSGLWDVQNTDSVVDLVTGLGVPLSKLIVTTPVQAFKFLLQNEAHTAPGSPALELSTLTRDELCVTMESEKWTLERDQDQAGPYIFRKNKWIAFEDATSMDIKAKYARVRGLAGLALKDLSQDGGAKCDETLLASAFNGLTKQARAPRGAVLHSLEREILEPAARPFDNVQVSPYRISRVIDTEGQVHAIRQDTRTEFKCSRQGYFVHPRSCNRFYRCVKFDQQSDEFSVFEFDCPAGLAFDERVEVCVWPGSLPDSAACAGSSEIAPVPKERFVCPETAGYYSDPENCRWFFACMDHGKSPLTAYEFRCPYGLVFDQDNLLCEWSWLVPKCGSGVAIHETVYGGYAAGGAITSGAALTGAGAHNALGAEGRDGAFDLDLYDGLGSLSGVHLGGLSGPLHTTQAVTYSNVDSGKEDYQLAGDGSNIVDHASQQQSGVQVASDSHGADQYYTGENDALKYYNAFAASRFAANAAGFEYDRGHQLNQQVPHSINIVAGGASGVADYAKNVNILQHGVKIDVESIKPGNLVSATTISPVPIVPNVPVPITGHLDTYNNLGVVANLPNLQYKLENPTIINHQLHQLGDVNTYKALYANNSSIGYSGYATNLNTINPFNGYQYARPSVPFAEGQKLGFASYQTNTYQKPQVLISGQYNQQRLQFEQKPLRPEVMKTYTYEQPFNGYHYDKPKVAFEHRSTLVQPIHTYHQVHIQQPSVTYHKPAATYVESTAHVKGVSPALTYQQVALQPATTYSEIKIQPSVQTYHEIQHGQTLQSGYHNDKPAIKFEEKQIVPATTYQQVNHEYKHEGYHYAKPAIKFEEQPIVPVTTYQEVKVQPSTNYQQVNVAVKHNGYHYEKPAIKFEEKPIVPVTTYHEVKPQPAVAYQQVNHEVKHEGYHYERPAIKFEEKPNVPITTYQEVKPQPAVTFQEVHHEAKHEGYHYERPAIKFEEKPIVPVTTYQEVKVQPAFTYHQVNQEVKHEGYHYEKPTIKFEERPIVPVTTYQETKVQPAVTYQQVNHEVKHEGYHYEKPTIKFEERPIVPVTTYQETNVQPAITYQQVNHEVKHEGYHYEKPAIKFQEQPIVPVTTYQEVKPQPAITFQQVNHEVKHEGYHYNKPTARFEEKPVVPATTYQQINVQHGYHYEKPAIKFEEKPIVPVTTYQEVKPQPAVTFQQVNHEVKHEGYHYEKPTIKFEEKPVAPATTYQEINIQQGYHYEQPAIKFEEKPIVPVATYQEVKPQPAATFQQVNHEVKHEGYHYEKPTIKFEEKPVAPATTYQEINIQRGYHYEKPAIKFEEKPATTYQHVNIQPVQTYQEIKHETPKALVIENYEKPKVVFEEKPTIPATTYQEINIQPAVTYQETKHEGYHYDKPKVVFEEKPVAKPTYLPPVNTYQEVKIAKPALPTYTYQQPYVDQNIQTQSYHEIHHKPAVAAYQEVKHEGYHYEKPKIVFEEKPIVPVAPAVTYQEVKHEGYHYEKPKVAFEEKPATTYQEINIQPAVTYHHYQKPSPAVTYQQTKQEGYYYEKPKFAFIEKPTPAAPTVSYIHHVQPQPTPVLSTYHEVKPLIVEQKPTYKQVIQAVTPKPVITNSFSINQYSQGYHYNKPTIAFEEKPAVKVVPAIPTYLPPRQVKTNPALQYIPAKPTKVYLPAPTNPAPPPKEYLPQVPVQTYLPAPQPTVKQTVHTFVKPEVQTHYTEYYNAAEIIEQPLVKTKAYKTGYHYQQPAIKFEYTTPKPTYQSTVATILAKAEPAPLQFYSYDSRLEHPKVQQRVEQFETVHVEQPVVPVAPVVPVTSKPIVRYEFSSLDYQPVQPVQPIVKEKLLIHVPDREYLPVVTTTRRPVIVTQRAYLPPRPPKRVYLPVTTTEKYVEITAPSRDYLPVTEILKIQTSTPAKEYLPVTKRVRTRPTTTTTPTPLTPSVPVREYLPVRTAKQPSREYLPIKSTTPPTREYLPVKSTSPPSRDYLPVSSTATPNREYLPGKQIENYEYQPEEKVIVATRRPKVIKVVKTRPIIKVNDFHPILSAKLGAQCTCTSNTLTLRRRKPQKSLKPQNDDATTRISDEEEYITNEDQQDTKYDQAPKKQSVIIVAEEEEDISQDDEIRKQDIAKAVDSGLKLVKSAVKQGVKEGVQEALAGKDFDRYGPGGVRGRSETLQGTVDCQRAGLFRHPKHCNKFYACRWDEGKKKFTLHVFNCPVHLTFDNNLGACNWPSQGPACVDNTLLPSN